MRKLTTYLKVFFASIFVFSFLYAPVVSAADQAECNDDKNARLLGLPKWYKYLEVSPDQSGRCTPTVETLEAALPIGVALLEALMGVGGLVAVVMVIVGSFRFITSQGNPDSAAAARKTIINSLVGLVIVIISTALVAFLGNSLSGG